MITLFKVHMPGSVTQSLLNTLFSGFIGQGKRVEEFEDALIAWTGNAHNLALNNGTSGLHLALRLANIGPGDEVISSPMTCTATNTPIVDSGATIVWSDIDPGTGNISPEGILDVLSSKTKAIVCIHWGGYPCDMDEIHAIARHNNLIVIEDAAHAFGAGYRERRIGSISDFTMFSFQAIKHLTTVDGGLLTCRKETDYKRGKLLRWYGIDRETESRELRCKNNILESGYKYHMNDVAATIGLEQLKYIDEILFEHRQNANYYNYYFKKHKPKRVKPLRYETDRISSYWLYTVLVDDQDEFIKHMMNKGIACSRAHTRNDPHSCFRHAVKRSELTGVKEFDEHQVNIPVGWWLSHEDREHIMNTIQQF